MNKILAVSGGIDSVVLFDLLYHDSAQQKSQLIVAHVDHGMRPSSATDAAFVQQLCHRHHVACHIKKLALGPNASEATARQARYDFLRHLARQYHAEIYLAHHLDDLIETALINLYRGTGWRGLSPMFSPDLHRPLLERGWRKVDILRYAGERELHFRQDPTNYETHYLRNRIRQQLASASPSALQNLTNLCHAQQQLRSQIEIKLQSLLPPNYTYQRSWFTQLPDPLASEFLRAALLAAGIKMTRPQLADCLQAIRTYPPEKSFSLPGSRLLRLHKTYFTLPQ